MKTETSYDQQAQDFLTKWGIRLTVTPTFSGKCPPFCDGKCIHGDEHRITLFRKGKCLSFPFWNSLNDANAGIEPSAYSVLACIGSDLNCPNTFEDFCGEYGYDQDSRKAYRDFKRCLSFSERLNAFFDGEEMQLQLQTIA